MKNESYSGIDLFRLPAALLIIAIHTSPLASFSKTGDFVLTRVAARVAVPFFFMTSAFFVITRYAKNAERLAAFMKRTAVIYAAAIVFYIPVNIYSGYFREQPLLPRMIKDVVFDGTFYHLWYLPASVMGALVAWYLVRKYDYSRAVAVSAVLYLIGLFGDSYFGIAQKVPGIGGFYRQIFQVSDYTRNGIFFAPVFFVLGGMSADCRRRISRKMSLIGFGVSFALMLAEAMTLHIFGLQRHDSMYIFLLPCVYFLFQFLLHFRGRRKARVKELALALYLIHPMMIVAVRLVAKVLHLQSLLVENSMVHYLAVCAASLLIGAVAVCLLEKYKTKKPVPVAERAYVDVDLNNLGHNVRTLEQIMPAGSRLMAVVKANAYGHGAYETAVYLDRIGVRAYAVATVDEGICLRKYGVHGEILILGYTDIRRAGEIRKYDLTQTLVDFAYADAINRQGRRIKAHLKIDTGMHRLGIDWEDLAAVKKVFAMSHIKVCGMYTHLCCPASRKPDDVAYTKGQIARFYKLLEWMERNGMKIPAVHVQSSYGLLNYPQLKCDYVRAGIALYGCLSAPQDCTVVKAQLRPVLSLKTRIALIRTVKAGDTVGYDRRFTAEAESRIAILPIGYGDGLPRNLSCGNGSVRIRQRCAPIVGLICMDQLAVDVTQITDAAVGDVATCIAAEADTVLSAPNVAARSGSISNELLSRLGERLPVVAK